MPTKPVATIRPWRSMAIALAPAFEENAVVTLPSPPNTDLRSPVG